MIEVSLSYEEFLEAVEIAKKRNRENRKNKENDGAVATEKSSLGVDIEGAVGEKAVSKYLNLNWSGDFKSHAEWLEWRKTGHDVCDFEVKTTSYKTGKLLVQSKNDDNSPYILVIVPKNLVELLIFGEPVEIPVRLMGWLYGRDAKKEEFWMTEWRRPCFAVPQKKLNSLDTLPLEG